MIWSDICWNLSCCKYESKTLGVTNGKSKQNKLRSSERKCFVFITYHLLQQRLHLLGERNKDKREANNENFVV